MGLLDKLRAKKETKKKEVADKSDSDTQHSPSSQQGKRIKRYTSDGKPVYE